MNDQPGPRRTRLLDLTERETEVMSLWAEGWSQPQIGKQLFIARGTVKTHLKHVYQKSGSRSRGEAIRWWLSRGK